VFADDCALFRRRRHSVSLQADLIDQVRWALVGLVFARWCSSAWSSGCSFRVARRFRANPLRLGRVPPDRR
jgi:hypothetical protein